MTARDAIALSRCHAAHRRLDDGRMAMACRAGEAITCYIERPSGLGYRTATPADGLDPHALGWEPSSPKEDRMAKHGPTTTGTPPEESAPVQVGERTTVTVEGEGAQQTADALAQALVDQAAAARPDVLSTGTRELPVTLTDLELTDVARRLASVIDEAEQEEANQDQAKAAMKERSMAIAMRQRQLLNMLRRGVEYRMIDVRTEADYAAGVAREVRVDTGEVLSSRGLTDRERQMPLAPDVAAAAEHAAVVHGEAAETEAK